METQHIPSYHARDNKGDIYARLAAVWFPCGELDESVLLHKLTSYRKAGLWNHVKAWFEGTGEPASGEIRAAEGIVHEITGKGGVGWGMRSPFMSDTTKFVNLDSSAIMTPTALDPETFGYVWNPEVVGRQGSGSRRVVTFPEYFRLQSEERWVPVKPEDVPPETGLGGASFDPPANESPEPYSTPDGVQSCWKSPGPVAGPYEVRPGDGSVVTYYWYRFADQPALFNADLTDAEREEMQRRVEMLHRQWTKDRVYIPPPAIGRLARIDPALIVTPPAGLEVGYVPIVTRQGAPAAPSYAPEPTLALDVHR